MIEPPAVSSSPPIALSVAAHDPLGGAGVAADLTTFAALGVHGMVALTAVTAQRFDAVERVEGVAADLLAAQLDAMVASCRIDAVKVGLLTAPEQVEVIVQRIERGALPAPVVDPVMVDGRGRRFVDPAVERLCRERLFPLARVLTPNRAEAVLLVGAADDADAWRSFGSGTVVVTGGGTHDDLVLGRQAAPRVRHRERIDTRNVRGSGCTFAAAITALLATGRDPDDAIDMAGEFVAERLVTGTEWTLAPAGTIGPVAHTFRGPQSTSAHASP